MQTTDLLGIWKLESRGGKAPQEIGIKISLLEFKSSGKYRSAAVFFPRFQGLMPETRYKTGGTWNLEQNILERTHDEHTYKDEVSIKDDLLQVIFQRADETDGFTMVYRRVAD